MSVHYADDRVTLYHGDCLDVLAELPEASVDAVVTDPPYELGFIMGRKWDASGIAYNTKMWGECLRVLKPGGHLLAFGGTRTWHRLACAIEDAGFEVRDSIAWLYGSGFPKSLDVSKAIDKAAGAERTEKLRPKAGHENFVGRDNMKALRESGALSGEGGFSRPWMSDPDAVERAHWDFAPVTDAAKQWQGWGTALKPAHEPIVVARKPFKCTVATNVLKHGTGALNIDACRVDSEPRRIENYASTGPQGCMSHGHGGGEGHAGRERTVRIETAGRWPTNVVLDEAAAGALDAGTLYGDSGGASRFFPVFPVFKYQAKAPKRERPSYTTDDGRKIAHPTVKPLELMRWLIRLVTPPGGVVLEPFAGSGATVEAAMLEHVRCIAIEREADYLPLITARLTRTENRPTGPAVN